MAFIELKTLGSLIRVTIRESHRVRRISVCVDHKGGVELIIPYGAPKTKAYEFLLQKERWIREKLTKINLAKFEDLPEAIFLLGKSHRIKYIDLGNNFDVLIKDGLITVHSPKDNAANVLRHYLQQYALISIKEIAETLAKEHYFKYAKISVKELKSRWGSCSSIGNLAFNWRIIFAPQQILHYLVTHELCHLKEMNHSNKFWTLVEKIHPEYKASVRWLKTHGHELYHIL
ncbi:M48 family metallopeptidase [Candidatus Bandiella euplotis]|uniref:M48 family metallopeptidase n=1 Tax=Candidatus Bandiella euplotis TaxID=1664265 RepID=A0ABZ0ULX2_9RICK|nr:SprT family zinc-dependent metalloprotease [Candidatus Bandiella woodruffii]WPX97148.1 M48 family metallopeptidase [Candidatus Bandiella woodruffii]